MKTTSVLYYIPSINIAGKYNNVQIFTAGSNMITSSDIQLAASFDYLL